MGTKQLIGLLLACSTVLAAGCAAPGPSGAVGSTSGSTPSSPKRITAAIQSEPATLNATVNPPGSGVPGAAELERLLSAGLSSSDDRGLLRPQLAEEVPTTENSLWKVFADGSMETTWRIRPAARWHDGTPFTTDDLTFTARVLQDAELPILRNVAYELVERIEATDPRSVVVRWTKPFIQADTLFNGPSLPKHLLERPYTESKATFTQLPYWTQEFVSTGPYRVRDLARGSYILLEASDSYVGGRPKIDEIEVRFILDAATLAANILAGSVDLTLGRGLSLDQALEVRDQWRDGRISISSDSWIVMYPQFLNPSPAVVANARFRRALVHAIDRQQMADVLQGGLVPPADVFLSPSQPEYSDVQGAILRYGYDPRQAIQLIEALGYAKGSDGAFRDQTGQPLSVEVRASGNRDINIKSILSVADYWRQIGLAGESVVMPPQRAQDREYVQTFPGFLLYNQPGDLNFLKRIRISQTPLAENNFVGNNNSRYVNPEFDAQIERVFLTIPRPERMEVLSQVVRHMTDQVLLLGLFYQATPTLISHRLQNVTTGSPWNASEWDVAS